MLNLLAVARFRTAMRALGITEVSLQGRAIRISPVPLPESKQMRLARLADGATYKAAVETISLKVPVGPDRRTPLRDVALLDHLHSLLAALLDYELRPYPDHIHLVMGSDTIDVPEGAPMPGLVVDYHSYVEQWRRVALGGLTVHVTPGDHMSILAEPRVTSFAALLQRIREGAL